MLRKEKFSYKTSNNMSLGYYEELEMFYDLFANGLLADAWTIRVVMDLITLFSIIVLNCTLRACINNWVSCTKSVRVCCGSNLLLHFFYIFTRKMITTFVTLCWIICGFCLILCQKCYNLKTEYYKCDHTNKPLYMCFM